MGAGKIEKNNLRNSNKNKKIKFVEILKMLTLSITSGGIGLFAGFYGGLAVGNILAVIFNVSQFEGGDGYFALMWAVYISVGSALVGLSLPFLIQRYRRRSKAKKDTQNMMQDILSIMVDRDSVCMGDDVEAHQHSFSVSLHAFIPELIDLGATACELAYISGGRATWIVEAGGYGGKPVAVVAQQWESPRLLVLSSMRVEDLFSRNDPTLFFKYWGQTDPDAVFDALVTNTPLPDRYSQN